MAATTGIAELDDYCRRAGIPLDRAALVRRNVQLKEAVKAYRAMTTMIMQVTHETVHQQKTPFADCSSKMCISFTEGLAKLDSIAE